MLLVVGMHRSGTSLLTQLLHHLGADLGDALLPAEAGVNDRGFWEHQEVVAIDEALLEALDHPWYDFRPLPPNWLQAPEVSALLPRAEALLQTGLGRGPLAAIKDPRLCLLLPFWEQAACAAGWTPKVILAGRHPDEVAASLMRRDPMGAATALLLWLRYGREAESASRHLPRAVVDYGALLEDAPAILARLGRTLALTWSKSPDEAAAEAVAPELRHQRGLLEEGPAALLDLARWAHEALGAERWDDLADCWARFDTLFAPLPWAEAALAEESRRSFDLSGELHRLGREHGHALETLRRRDAQLDRRTREWEALGKDLEHCRSVVTERDEQLRLLNAEHQRIIQHPMVRLARKLFRF